MDQPGKVANSARGHLTSVCFLPVYSGRQVRLGVPAGVSQEKRPHRFLIYLLSTMNALFLARRIHPFLSLVEICVRLRRMTA